METNSFLHSFVTGEYKLKRCGQYKIFDENELTGEPFNCAILMHNSTTGGWPSVVGIYFGNGIVVYDPKFNNRNPYRSRSLSSLSKDTYSANLSLLHKKLDLTDSRPVDYTGTAAVVDIGGRDFLLDTPLVYCAERITKEEFITGTRSKLQNGVAVPLCGRVSSVEEARESLVPNEVKTTPGSFYFGGLSFAPNDEVEILDVNSSEMAKTKYVYGRPPLPSLNGVPIDVFSDAELFEDSSMKYVEHWGADEGKLRWRVKLTEIGRTDYIEKIDTWLEAKETLYSTLNIDGRSNPDGVKIAASNGAQKGMKSTKLSASRSIGRKLYTTGRLDMGEHSIDLGSRVYEVLYPNAGLNFVQ